LRRWYAGDEANFTVEKAMLAAAVTSSKWRRPFIGGGARIDGKRRKSREKKRGN
jgi:hypothetical protein